MSTQISRETKPELDLTEADVEKWLYQHPDFFARHDGLLEILRVPHQTFGATSLLERQIHLLRRKNNQLEGKLRGLVAVARENEKLSSRLHNLALALVEADSLDAVLSTAREQLLEAFHADFVRLALFSDKAGQPSGKPEHQAEITQLFTRAFNNRRPQCGGMGEKHLAALFPEHAAEVGSAVFVPLVHIEPVGYLALGSQRETRFHPGMGTLFLGYLGELVTRAIVVYQQRAME
jgi:uncharacterized protein YigA (DUF484 family)